MGYKSCTTCGGRGSIEHNCLWCNGKGYTESVGQRYEPGTSKTITFTTRNACCSGKTWQSCGCSNGKVYFPDPPKQSLSSESSELLPLHSSDQEYESDTGCHCCAVVCTCIAIVVGLGVVTAIAVAIVVVVEHS